MTRTFKVGDKVKPKWFNPLTSVYIIRAPCEYAPDGWWLTNPTGAEAGWSNESQLELYALTYTLDVTFDNVDDAIAAAELLSARFKRDIPVKVG